MSEASLGPQRTLTLNGHSGHVQPHTTRALHRTGESLSVAEIVRLDLDPYRHEVLIDRGTAERDHWSDLKPEALGQFGIYDVWRLDRSRLEQRAQTLKASGVEADWRRPRPERY